MPWARARIRSGAHVHSCLFYLAILAASLSFVGATDWPSLSKSETSNVLYFGTTGGTATERYVNIPSFAMSGPLTIEFTFKSVGARQGESREPRILEFTDDVAGKNKILVLMTHQSNTPTKNGLYLLYSNSAGTEINNGWACDSEGTGALSFGTWYHIAIVINADGTKAGYCNNGAAQPMTNAYIGTHSPLPSATRQVQYLGKSFMDTNKIYLTDFYMGGFRIWKSALSAGDVGTLYNGGSVAGDLYVYYKFDDLSSQAKVKDYSGGGYDGTIIGDASVLPIVYAPGTPMLPSDTALLPGDYQFCAGRDAPTTGPSVGLGPAGAGTNAAFATTAGQAATDKEPGPLQSLAWSAYDGALYAGTATAIWRFDYFNNSTCRASLVAGNPTLPNACMNLQAGQSITSIGSTVRFKYVQGLAAGTGTHAGKLFYADAGDPGNCRPTVGQINLSNSNLTVWWTPPGNERPHSLAYYNDKLYFGTRSATKLWMIPAAGGNPTVLTDFTGVSGTVSDAAKDSLAIDVVNARVYVYMGLENGDSNSGRIFKIDVTDPSNVPTPVEFAPGIAKNRWMGGLAIVKTTNGIWRLLLNVDETADTDAAILSFNSTGALQSDETITSVVAPGGSTFNNPWAGISDLGVRETPVFYQAWQGHSIYLHRLDLISEWPALSTANAAYFGFAGGVTNAATQRMITMPRTIVYKVPMSFEWNLKFTQVQDSSSVRIFDFSDGAQIASGSSGFVNNIIVFLDGMRLKLSFHTGGTSPVQNTFEFLSDASLDLNTWYHVVLAVGADGVYVCYLNGVAQTASTSVKTLAGAVVVPPEYRRQLSLIGHSVSTVDGILAGAYIGGFRVWKKKLSAAEVASLRAGGTVSGQFLVYYKFDDAAGSITATDYSLKNRHANISADITFVTFSSQPSLTRTATQVLRFGTSGGLTIPSFALKLPLTIELVFKINEKQSSLARILDLGNGATDNNLILQFVDDGASNRLRLSIYNGNSGTEVKAELFTTNNVGVILPDQWYHAVVILQTDGKVTSYLNNVTYSTGSGLSAVMNGATRALNYIGKPNKNGDPYLTNALIQSFRIWSTTLSAGDVASLYAGNGAVGSVYLHYKFDDNPSGTTVKDYGGAGLDGTITGDAKLGPPVLDLAAATGIPAGSCGLRFDGTGGNGALAISGTGLALATFTVDFWVLQDAKQTKAGRVFEVGAGASVSSMYLAMQPTALRMGVFNAAGTESYVDLLSVTAGLPVKNWTHVAITVSKVSGSATDVEIKSYLNTKLIDTKTSDWQAALASAGAASNQSFIGGRPSASGSAPANITLASFRLWGAVENASLLYNGVNTSALANEPLQMLYRLDEPPPIVYAADASTSGALREANVTGSAAAFSCGLSFEVAPEVTGYSAKLRMRVFQTSTWTGSVVATANCTGGAINVTSAPVPLQFPSETFTVRPVTSVRVSVTADNLAPSFQYTCTAQLLITDHGITYRAAAPRTVVFSTLPIPPTLPLKPPTPTLLYFSDKVLLVQINIQSAAIYPPLSSCDLYIMQDSEVLGHAIASALDLQTTVGRRANVRALTPNTNYTFFTRCWNELGVGPNSDLVTFSTDGPPLQPDRPFRLRATSSSFTLIIYKPYMPPYFSYPANSFVCKAIITSINSGALRGEAATVTLEEFGAASSVTKTVTSYMLSGAQTPVAMGFYQVVTTCSNSFGKGPDSIAISFRVSDAQPPSAPSSVAVAARVRSAVVSYRPAIGPAGDVQFCASSIAGTEVFRSTRVLNNVVINKNDGTQLYCMPTSNGQELCGSLVGGTIVDITAPLSGLSAGTSYTISVSCSNANGVGTDTIANFKTNVVSPPNGLTQVAAEAQYASVSFNIDAAMGGGLPFKQCSIFASGTFAGNVSLTVEAGSPILVTNPKILQLQPKTAYQIAVECSHSEGSARSAPLTVTTKDSSVVVDFSKISNLKTNDKGELQGTVASTPPTCTTTKSAKCLWTCQKIHPRTGQPGGCLPSEQTTACSLRSETEGKNCKRGGCPPHPKMLPRYPEWWQKTVCTPTVSATTTTYPATLKVTVVKRGLLQASDAEACISNGVLVADAAAGIQCGLYEDARGSNVRGNIVTVCQKVATSEVVGSKYCFASANKVVDKATGKVSVTMPDDLPELSDLTPKNARSRALLQTADGTTQAGPAFVSTSGYDMGLKDLRTGDSLKIGNGMSTALKSSGIGIPSDVKVAARTYRSITLTFGMPSVSAVSASGDIMGAETCSVLSVGSDGAESVVGTTSVVGESSSSTPSVTADGLLPGTLYQLAIRCSNAYGSGNRSAVVKATTKVTNFVISTNGTAPAEDGTLTLVGGPLLQIPPKATADKLRTCLPGYYVQTPTVKLGTFASDGTPTGDTSPLALNATLFPPINAAAPVPSTSVCFVLPESPYAAASGGRRLAASSGFSLGTPYSLALSDSTSTTVIRDAIVWQRLANMNLTNLNCTSSGRLVRCARAANASAGAGGAEPLIRVPRRTAGAAASTIQFSWPGTFAAAPTSILLGKFDSQGAATCAATASNIEIQASAVLFKFPDAPPPGCAVGSGTGRALLLTTDTAYDLQINQADGETVLISNFVVYGSSPSSLAAWRASDGTVTASAGSNSGGSSSVGLGLGLGLGLGCVLLIAVGIWFLQSRHSARKRVMRASGSTSGGNTYGGQTAPVVYMAPTPHRYGNPSDQQAATFINL